MSQYMYRTVLVLYSMHQFEGAHQNELMLATMLNFAGEREERERERALCLTSYESKVQLKEDKMKLFIPRPPHCCDK